LLLLTKILKPMTKLTRLIVASIAGCILFFFLGWLIYGVLLMDFYVAHTTPYEGLMREMPNLAALIIAQLTWSFLLAFIIQRWEGAKNFGRGLWIGLLLSFLVILMIDLFFVASMKLYDAPVIIVDIVINTVLGGLIGGVMGWIFGMEKKKVEA
jgi:hypothetical protein